MGIVIVVGVPFAISTAYLWERARLSGILQRKGSPGSRTVEGEKLLLKDTSGKGRAVMTVSDGGPSLAFYDASGTVRAWMGLLAERPTLTLSDNEQASKVQVTVLEDGPHVVLYDANGQLRAIFDVLPEGPGLEI